jgi:hypothetical protein
MLFNAQTAVLAVRVVADDEVGFPDADALQL